VLLKDHLAQVVKGEIPLRSYFFSCSDSRQSMRLVHCVRYSRLGTPIIHRSLRSPVSACQFLASKNFKRNKTNINMSFSEDDDPQLAAALLLSIQEQQHSPSGRKQKTAEDIVDLTGDSDNERQSQKNTMINLDEEEEEEDNDLKRAIALSMQQSRVSEDPKETSETPGEAEIVEDIAITSKQNEQPPTSQPSNAFSILGLDRKKLEQERLARIAKRKAEQSISPPPLSRERKAAKYTVVSPEDVTTKPLVSLQSSSSQMNPATPIDEEKKQVPSTTPSSTPSIQFPKGTVKKTWVFSCPRKGDDIKIEEVLQCSDLELAVLSAFQFDMEWLFAKFQTSKTRFMLLMQAKDEMTVSFTSYIG
jgi:hypothetical protein